MILRIKRISFIFLMKENNERWRKIKKISLKFFSNDWFSLCNIYYFTNYPISIYVMYQMKDYFVANFKQIFFLLSWCIRFLCIKLQSNSTGWYRLKNFKNYTFYATFLFKNYSMLNAIFLWVKYDAYKGSTFGVL